MTPLAHRIVKELTLPVKRRTFQDHVGLLAIMDDVHCFECSDVYEVAKELAGDIHRRPDQIERLAFLPAPKTWIEIREGGGRVGILLRELKNHSKGDPLVAMTYYADGQKFASSPNTGMLELVGVLDGKPPTPMSLPGSDLMTEKITTYLLYALLAMINTPRLIGRRQHMPHAGLERDLTRTMKSVGKYPLHAWTEIKLEVGGVPHDLSGEPSAEAHLIGQRALHFCRAHLRIRLGRLEIVRGHWRGDPALGIKQSRYTLRGGR